MSKTYYIDFSHDLFSCGEDSVVKKHYDTHWKPIVSELRDIFELKCGLTEDPLSDFRIYQHATKKKIPFGSLFYMQMHLPHLYSVDTKGWGVSHSLANSDFWTGANTQIATDSCLKIKENWLKFGSSKENQPPPSEIEHEDYILLTLQIPYDSVIKDYSPISVINLACWLSTWASFNRKLIVVKPHPGSSGTLLNKIRYLTDGNPYFVYSDSNIHSLIDKCRAVMTINSGTGFEALIHGRPVITFGRCDYEELTFRAKIFDLCPEQVDSFICDHPYKESQLKFAHDYIFSKNYWIGKDPDAEGRLMDFVSSEAKRFYS